MNTLTSLQRKLVYLGGIIALFIPIILLGAPPEPASGKGVQASPGGKLARLRTEKGLGEGDLGNVDPASSTMNLLLLGFRGIATSVLWMDAQEQQRNKDWAALRATTESIILLQPHFLKVWNFQGWNLAYNVSAEWDAVADRYYWVKEGIKFFKKGCARNEKYAELFWYTGDTLGKKIGRSDEWVQFRRFYIHADPDTIRFKGRPDPDVNPDGIDNYREARKWFLRCNETVDRYGNEQHIMARYLVRAYPVRALFDYASTLQREGIFDEVGRDAWHDGFVEWTTKYGKEEFDCRPVAELMVHLELDPEEREKRLAEDRQNPNENQRYTSWVDKYQNVTNYRYWRTKSQVESEQEMSDAHREMYAGEQALDKADLSNAAKYYWDGMTKYEKLLNDYPDLKAEDETIDEGLLAQMGWRQCLELMEEEIPEEYPLKEMWESKAGRRAYVTDEFNRRRRGSR
ncbi:MAG: hypothetical protein ACM3U2_22040 [Deltaproteobacteria bacterium]